MARRRTRFRIPFLPYKLNKHTVSAIIGCIFFGTGLLFTLSYTRFLSQNDSGRILNRLNGFLTTRFGFMSIFIPVILILISGHLFSSKKFKIVKPNMTAGITLVFVSLLGVLRSGSYGSLLFDNLSLDFTPFGALLILSILFVIGLILFLDTSIDVFLLFVVRIIKSLYTFLMKYVFRSFSASEKRDAAVRKNEPDYIRDTSKKPVEVARPVSSLPANLRVDAESKDFNIRPLPMSGKATWVYPPLSLLADVSQQGADRGDTKHNALTIERTLDSFGIQAQIKEVNYGPAVTQYALEIARGIKLSKITALGNDLALSLAAPTGTVRIEAPIPGKSLVGIEIPNIRPEIVPLKNMLSTPIFTSNPDPLLVPLGLDVSGQPRAASISKMPHVLIAGTTGSGKSVILNAWISTFLFRTKPEELRLILVDPKRVELTIYNGIPHLLSPVIVEPEKIINALRFTVKEMENRLKEFAQSGARDIDGYNAIPHIEKKPFILFIIDELADLMMYAANDAEGLITRIAQLARATGIHLVLATQRPSVDVITGLMKANIPARIAFNVSSMVDSRVIIDMPGAEKLLGRGDMLFLPPDQAKPRRIQGPYITVKEANQVVKFLKAQTPVIHYTEEVTEDKKSILVSRGGTVVAGGGEKDPLFESAITVVTQFNKASASLLQRRLSVGYARAAKLLDQLEEAGIVGPAEGAKPREVLKRGVQQMPSEDTVTP